MDKITQIEKIKERAKGLLDVNIIETDLSPMIVSHPFTKYGILLIPDKGEMSELNIVENKTAFVKWKELMAEQIDNAENVYHIYYLLNDSYALYFFDYISDLLSSQDYSLLLASSWINSEYANCDANIDKKRLLKHFQNTDIQYLLNEEELEVFHSLDEKVTIYRGVTPYNRNNIKALSWTLSFDTASWFANRFNSKGKVYSATIDKSHIYAYFDGKNESEVIVDPNYLENIRQVSEPILQTENETPNI